MSQRARPTKIGGARRRDRRAVRPAHAQLAGRGWGNRHQHALSPRFTIEPEFDHAEILLDGGWSERVNDRENQALQFVDAAHGEVLLEILPPGTYVLRTQRVSLDHLKGRTVRVKLVDDNCNAGFAWIGLWRLTLIGNVAAAVPGTP